VYTEPNMLTLAGYAGWRWIFILGTSISLQYCRTRLTHRLEGVLTCVVSFAWFFVIPSFPENAKWLSPEEKEYVRARLQQDQGKSALERPITFRDVMNCFKDYKFFLGGLMYFGLIVPAYGVLPFGSTDSWIRTKGHQGMLISPHRSFKHTA
jgi:MFS family permease